MAYDVDHIGTYEPTIWENYTSTKTPINAANLNKIDNAIDVLDDEAYLSRERVDTLGNLVNDLNTEVQQFDTRITTNTNSITSLRGTVDTLDDDVQTLSTTVSGFNNRITTNTNNISNLRVRVTDLESEVYGGDTTDKLSDLDDVRLNGEEPFEMTQKVTHGDVNFTGEFTYIQSVLTKGYFEPKTYDFQWKCIIRKADGTISGNTGSMVKTISTAKTNLLWEDFDISLDTGDVITQFTVTNTTIFEYDTRVILSGKKVSAISEPLQDGDVLTYDSTNEVWVNKPTAEADFGLFVQNGLIYCRYESE